MYALDARTVLRRYRRRDVPAREVAVMRYVRERGYPAPEIVRADGTDLVLERATGSTMRTRAPVTGRTMSHRPSSSSPLRTSRERELIPLVPI